MKENLAPATANAADRLAVLQVLRAVAAMMVVWHHAIKAYALTTPDFALNLIHSLFAPAWFREGLGSGVDIFFVISGFIMVHGAGAYLDGRRRPQEFLLRRLQRIFPPYWIVSGLFVALIWGQSHGRSPELGAFRLVTSFFLFPSATAGGDISPVLGVGWTLSYEIYFYILFFLALVAGGRRYPVVLAATLGGIWAVAAAVGNLSAPGRFLADPVALEFLYGAGIALLLRHRQHPAAPVAGFAVAMVVMFAGSWLHVSGAISDQARVIYRGMPAALFVYTALARSQRSATVPGGLKRFWIRVGDSSYSLYLTHILVIYYLAPPLARALIVRGLIAHADLAIFLSVLVSLLVGFAFHHAIEKPLQPGRLKRPDQGFDKGKRNQAAERA